MLRHADHLNTIARLDVRVGIGKHIQLAATCTHFLDVGLELLEQRVVRGHRHDRHLVGHQGQRAVLEFTGRVGLGVDVGDFLELERAFQGNRVVQATAQEQRVLTTGKLFRPRDDLRLQRQHGVQCRRQVAQVAQGVFFLRVAQMAAQFGKRQRQHVQRSQLRGERLGGGHTDFRAGTREELEFGLAHHGAGRHVAHSQRVLVAQFACVAQRGQRVGGLARLRDHHDQRVRVGHRLAIAVFAGDFHLCRDLSDRLQPVLGGAARVVARAAGQDQHAVDLGQHLGRIRAEQVGAKAQHAINRVAQRARLLEDFLLHEVAERAEFHGGGVPTNLLDLALGRLVMHVHHGEALAGDLHHVAFFQVGHAAGGAGHGQRVGGEERLAIAQRHHQRRPCARTHHHVGVVASEHGNRVGAMQALDARAHRGKQVAARGAARVRIGLVDQVGDHLGVGLRFKAVADGLELVAQRFVVLDDAVVHQGDGVAREVRVGVDGIRLAVRGPARVGDADGAVQVAGLRLRVEVGHARHGAHTLELAIALHGNTARVVAAVFQTAQAFDQDGNDIARGNRADDTAHVDFSSLSTAP